MKTDRLSKEEQNLNEEACKTLVRGRFYKFDPPIEARGFLIGGQATTDPPLLKFDRGWYLAFTSGSHVFQGKPVIDKDIVRPINNKNSEYYFHVVFIGDVKAELDEDQNYSKK